MSEFPTLIYRLTIATADNHFISSVIYSQPCTFYKKNYTAIQSVLQSRSRAFHIKKSILLQFCSAFCFLYLHTCLGQYYQFFDPFLFGKPQSLCASYEETKTISLNLYFWKDIQDIFLFSKIFSKFMCSRRQRRPSQHGVSSTTMFALVVFDYVDLASKTWTTTMLCLCLVLAFKFCLKYGNGSYSTVAEVRFQHFSLYLS